jgi:predicted metal-binding membrane protein
MAMKYEKIIHYTLIVCMTGIESLGFYQRTSNIKAMCFDNCRGTRLSFFFYLKRERAKKDKTRHLIANTTNLKAI